MEQALIIAIQNCFPEDVIQYIYNQLGSFDINKLWTSFAIERKDNIGALQILLKMGANVNYQLPETLSTPIMYFAQSAYKNMVLVMLEHGADLTIKNSSGKDVYYYAKESMTDISIIIKEFNEKKEKDELINRNKALENQCLEMNDKLNYLFGMFQKLNVGEIEDLTHKKYKAIGDTH